MKMVQKSLTPLFRAICASLALLTALGGSSKVSAEAADRPPEFLQHFDPAMGFKPAQANLTKVFLQIAGSLECFGSPEPYLRHMQEEHKRIDRLYEEKTGKSHTSRLPAHMTDAYIDRLIRNWNTLSLPLGLDAFAKQIGDGMREGIMGTRLSGTFAVQIFNEHQKLVAAGMEGNSAKRVGFDDLKKRLEHDLEFNKESVTMVGYEVPRRDAVRYALILDGRFKEMFEKIDSVAKPDKAAAIKQSLLEWFFDLGYMAESELEIGILESALKQR